VVCKLTTTEPDIRILRRPQRSTRYHLQTVILALIRAPQTEKQLAYGGIVLAM
jgi:hypothetical protein